ncbi:MAG TPA: cupin domain-containing protein [Dehalococcoidia bacterium]|nr:cupin domain-containing protein [Dehalococcoidia bacterium]
MPANQDKKMTSATMGDGVHDPMKFTEFHPQEGNVVIMYAEDPDANLVVWNLEPGQENSTHVHPASTHIQIVLQGSGVYLKDGKEVPVKKGDVIIVPRNVVHGIRAGNERLSYMAVTAGESYDRRPVGEQKVSIGDGH